MGHSRIHNCNKGCESDYGSHLQRPSLNKRALEARPLWTLSKCFRRPSKLKSRYAFDEDASIDVSLSPWVGRPYDAAFGT